MSGRFANRAAVVLMTLGAIYCAPPGSRPSPTRDLDAVTRSNSTTIIAEDLEATLAPNLYQAIQALHPEWFRRIGGTINQQSRGLAVFIDRTYAGGVEVLQQTGVSHAKYVRYYSASEAQMRFGEGYLGGVILVATPLGNFRP